MDGPAPEVEDPEPQGPPQEEVEPQEVEPQEDEPEQSGEEQEGEVEVEAAAPEPEPEADPGPEPEPTPAEPAPRAHRAPRHTPPSRELADAWVVEIWVDPDWYAEQGSDDPCPSPGLPVVLSIDHLRRHRSHLGRLPRRGPTGFRGPYKHLGTSSYRHFLRPT